MLKKTLITLLGNVFLLGLLYVFLPSESSPFLFIGIAITIIIFEYAFLYEDAQKNFNKIRQSADKLKIKNILLPVIIAIYLILFLGQQEILFLPQISPVFLFFILTCLFSFYFLLAKPKELIVTENNKYVSHVIFVFILIGAAVLRFFDIENQNIGVDSVRHVNGAMEILQTGHLEYTRGYIYTYALAGFQKIFGTGVTTAIAFNIVLNLIFLIIFYGISRKLFNQKIALIGSFLLALSPFSIWMSYFVRLYAGYQIVFFIFIYAFYKFIISKPHYRITRKTLLELLALGVLFLLATHFHRSIFSVGPPIAAYLFLKAVFKAGETAKGRSLKRFLLENKFLVVSVMLILTGKLIYEAFYGYFTPYLQFTLATIPANDRNYFFLLLNQFSPYITIFFSALTLSYCFFSKRYKETILFFLVILFLSAFEYIYLITRFFSPRYIFHLLPLLILIMAVGIMVAAKLIQEFCKKKWFTVIATILLTVSVIPLTKLQEIYTWPKIGENPIIEINYPYEKTLSALQIEENYPLAEINPGIWETFQDKSSNITNLSRSRNKLNEPLEENTNRFIKMLIEYPEGLLLTDIYRQKHWKCGGPEMLSCFATEMIEDSFVELLQDNEIPNNNLLLYKWQVVNPIKIERAKSQTTTTIFNFMDIFSLKNIRPDNIEITQNNLNFDLQIVPTAKNKNNFLVIKAEILTKEQKPLPLTSALLFVPQLEKSETVYTYNLSFSLLDEQKEKLESIESEQLYLDLYLYDTSKQTKNKLTPEPLNFPL